MALEPPKIRTAESSEWKSYRQAIFDALPKTELFAFRSWVRTFYTFQQQWLFEPEAFALMLKSRQIGISHTTGGVGILWGVAFGETTTIVSVGEREAKEVLDKAKAHAGLLRDFGSQWARISGRDSAEEIRFASGGRIIAVPSSGARGLTGNLFLDEAAYLQHPKKAWDAASSVAMHNYRLRVSSTPNGVGDEFHALATNPRQHAGYALHNVPIHRAIADGMNVDVKTCWKIAKGDPRLFSQLFECKFLDGELQYIPGEYVSRASVDDLYTWEGEFFAGLDIGRTNDLTALIVVRLVGDTAYLVSLRTCKRTDQPTLDALVDDAFAKYQLRRLCVDATGIGAFPAESMQRKFGRHRVEPVNFTQGSKEDMASRLYQYFKADKIRIPLSDGAAHDCEHGGADALRQDVCSIQRIITTAGNVRYDAPRTDEGHADRAWALALALLATGNTPSTKIIDTTR